MNTHSSRLAAVCALSITATAMAQEETAVPGVDAVQAVDEEAIHDDLRAMRAALTTALEEGDVDGQLAHVHDNVVVTWQNNRVVRGTGDLKKFLGEMNTGDERVFQGYKVPPTADELTILYGGDTGIAFGKSTPHYNYMGMEFDLENRWTATLVRDGEQWKIASYHVSGNIMDNPVLAIAKQSVYWVGGIGLVVGMLLGFLFARLTKSAPKPA